MKIIIGLGNPGKKYQKTRHNIGFDLIDLINKELEFPDFNYSKKFNAEISEKKIKNEKIILVKPQTFMNKSGESVKCILDFYKSNPSEIMVIHDDLDLQIGTFKIAENSSSAGHNGVQNIINLLETKDFKRIRIGIGDSQCKIDAHNFVLGKFNEKEIKAIENIIPELLQSIKETIQN